MAGSDKIVTINVGTQRVSAAVFSPAKKNGLLMHNYVTASILADPSAEGARLAQIGATIAEITSALKLKGSQVYYSLPGQSVFIRFIKLPPIDESDIPQLVQFEAQQHIPFPLNEVIWDYHLLPDNGLEKEAVLVAIKADSLNEIDSLITSSGLKTTGVDSAPTALYNAFVHSYPDLQESALLIDIGAKTSNLIYAENGRFFTRGISKGGASITAAIAREYNLSFSEAEELKTSKGLVALAGGHTSTMDEETARLATCIRNAMNMLVSEIPRTTNHYCAQFGGTAPKHIFLCGGGVTLPYLREFIQERLQVTVQFFNPLHNVSLAKSIDTEALSRDAYLIGETIGLGLKAMESARISIDLIPTAVAKAQAAKKKLPFAITGMVALIAAGGIFAYTAGEGVKAAQTALDQQNQILDQVKSIQQQIAKTIAIEKKMDTELGVYQGISALRFAFSDILGEMAKRAASDAYWIVELDPIMGYNKDAPDSVNTGTSVINKTFATDKTLSFNNVAPVDTTLPQGRGKSTAAKEKAAINAIRLRGLVRMDNAVNTEKQGFENVNWIINKLNEPGVKSAFDLSHKGVPIEASKIIKLEDTPANKDAFAKPFTLVLPLTTPIIVE